MIAEKLVPGFEIFAEEVNGIREVIVKDPIVEELIQASEPKNDVPMVEQRVVDDQQKEQSSILSWTSFMMMLISL